MIRPDPAQRRPAQRRLLGFTLGAAVIGWAMMIFNIWELFA